MNRVSAHPPDPKRLKRMSVPGWLLLQALGVEGQRMRLQVTGLPADAQLVNLAIDTASGVQMVDLWVASDEFPEVSLSDSVPYLAINYHAEHWPVSEPLPAAPAPAAEVTR